MLLNISLFTDNMYKKEVISFILIGVVSTIINYSLFSILILSGIYILFANAIGYCSGLAVGYILNRKFTFKSTSQVIQSLPKYIGLYISSMCIGLVFLSLLTTYDINIFIANLLTIGLTTVINFITSKFISFNDQIKLSPIFLEPLFYAGLLIRIIAGYHFSSPLLDMQFTPFIEYFINTGFDPYIHFLNTDTYFPYMPGMLYILSAGYMITSLKIPLLLADIIALYFLARMHNNKRKNVLYLFWLNPILVWITYIHGQLDILPISLIIASYYYLIHYKFIHSSILLGLSIWMKHSSMLFLPIFLIYIYKKRISVFATIQYLLTVVVIPIALSMPFILRPAFHQMVLNNKETARLFSLAVSSGEYVIYLTPLIMSISILFMFINKSHNKYTLAYYSCIIPSIFLILLPFQPGWFLWSIPFTIHFANFNQNRIPVIFISLCLSYSLVHILQNRSLFTLLITNFIFLVLYITYIFIQNKKFQGNPKLIGIAGDSGAGKTTLTEILQSILPSHDTLVIRGDDLHKWERGDKNWKSKTHLHPESNNLHKGVLHAWKLKSGQTIYREHYDHSTGKFTQPIKYMPKNYTIFEGLHEFFIPKMRQLCDLKIYIDIQDELRTHWKVLRDLEKRGYTKEKVIKQLADRAEDSLKFIKPQKKFSDITIEYIPNNKITEYGTENVEYHTYCSIPINYDYYSIIDLFNKFNVQVTHQINPETIRFKHDNSITDEQVESILLHIHMHPDIHIGNTNSVIFKESKGFLQVIIAFVIKHGNH